MGTARGLGLKDVYVAPVTTNTTSKYVCGVPQELARGITAKITTKINSDNLYSNSALEDTVSQFSEVDVELEVDHLTMAKIALLKGATLTNGVLTEKNSDESSEVALMFRDRRNNGKYEFVCLYVGKFFTDSLDEEYKTSEDKVVTSTRTIKGVFRGRECDGAYRCRVMEDELVSGTDADAQTIITNWYTAVPNQVAA